MKNISVIIPVHEYNEDTKPMLVNALTSLDSAKELVDVFIVHPGLKGLDTFENVTLINNAGQSDFASQVNAGIEQVKTEFFSILEMDDEYAPTWFKNVEQYISAYSDVDVFLPIVADVDEEQKFLAFINESVWAMGFTDKQGFLDHPVLMDFANYQISGGVYRTEKIKKLGKLKTRIKLTFGYEFLLRLTHNNAKIMTIPKVGYKHINMRYNSLFWKYKNDPSMKLTPEENKFWVETAKSEHFYTADREVEFTAKS